jgi:hypothetical protein
MRPQSPEHIARRAAAISNARMAWCPQHLRDEHKRLVRVKKVPAAQAREIILNQWQAEMARRNAA